MKRFSGGWFLLPAAGLLLGCSQKAGGGHSHAGGDGDGHSHGEGENEPRMEAVTAWGARHEVFAEHPPLVEGAEARWLVHVTDLGGFAPRTQGAIVLKGRSAGGAEFEHVENEPARPGIYTPKVALPEAGEWRLTVSIPDDRGQDQVQWPVATVYPSADAAARAQSMGAEEGETGIALLKEQQWQLGVQTALVGRRPLAERVHVPGRTRAKPGLSAEVRAPLAGQIEAPDSGAAARLGMEVRAGQVLALLRPQFSEAAAQFVAIQAEHGRAEAELKQAEAAFARMQKLAAAEARSQREVQEAEAALASARARLDASRALRSTYAGSSTNAPAALELRSPIDGVIASLRAGPGEVAPAGEILFTVLDLRTLWIEAQATESAFARITEAGEAICEVLDGSGRTFRIASPGGRLVHAGLEVDGSTGTIPLVYEVENGEARLRAGQSVRLQIQSSGTVEALAVPYSALVEEGGQFVVYVQAGGETFVRREVTLGIRDGDWVQVIAGVAEGERVVSQGAYLVRLAASSSAIPDHGHAH